ncbi:SRPBCC family protein [Burkholderiaceae bacterium DAT-1]|nr:SRPBCC family protein [Burkholderiaceae bacterium DAT-1]
MKVSVFADINSTPAELFHLSQDYQRRLEWDVYLSEAYLLGDAIEANVGVDSFCKGTSGAVMISRYVSFTPPSVAAVTMIKGPLILDRFSGSWSFKSCEGGTRVTFTYNFRTRPAWLRSIIEPCVAWLYRRDMARRLLAFKRWVETKSGEAK